MQLNIYKDYQSLSESTANTLIETVISNPTAVLCLATGDTPKLTYELLVNKAIERKVDFSRCTFIGLDEWVGIPPRIEGSCRFFLQSRIFGPLNIQESQVHLFDGMSHDPRDECSRMDDAIVTKGGIDLMLVGVGVNGHIGFNEPGAGTDVYSHLVDLHGITQSVGQKYFTGIVQIKQGLTLGFKTILQSKKLIMIANGLKKAAVMQKALEEEITTDVPAGLVRAHPFCWTVLDEEAASLLNLQILPEEIVMGHIKAT